jgi:ABC-2 type transport system ATP-binding protein
MNAPGGRYTIETHELTRVFGRQVAVDRISIAVEKGEIFGFLGANGAGKTTAMRMLCGLLVPSGGSGRVAGFDIIRETPKIRTRIGYMPQKFSLYTDLTIRENLILYGSLYGLAGEKLKERMAGMAAFLDMEKFLLRRTGDLPWGWQQRLALACANLHGPEILFLDEPTGSVDPVSRAQFWDLIKRLSDAGTTVFVTTHHMDEAEYCRRVSIMVEGRIAAVDTPEGLKQRTGKASLNDAFIALVEREGARL